MLDALMTVLFFGLPLLMVGLAKWSASVVTQGDDQS